ncbi:MAG: DUF2235 domain-containing protein [Cyanobacteriota bacterium]|nr:DUF2235 domain-containing protein [Cyanobacteriota bacterium]
MKRLIVCCDGTWQNLECPYPTNVVKIAQAIEPESKDGITQAVYYHGGVGTGGSTPAQKEVDRISGGAFGQGIDQNIQDAYRFLCLNYSLGDEIYLFGFSRGAYTVRSLAGLMYNSGLLSRPNLRHIPESYRLYRNRLKPDHPDIAEFRQKYSVKTEKYGDRVPITLLACWDTVGSLGIPDINPFIKLDRRINQKYEFHDSQLSPIVQNALHAVAIDEQRSTFYVAVMAKNEKAPEQRLIQKWFPGDHGCVGGGSQKQSGLADGTLKWMVDSIRELDLGIEIDPDVIPTGVNPDPLVDYRVTEQGFFGKLTQLLGKKVREVSDEFDDLHESVKVRWQNIPDYRPDNVKTKFGELLDKSEG